MAADRVTDAYETIPPESKEHEELVLKCQDNWWLKRGGIPWEEDPYLEDYPYEFARVGDVESLRKFFLSGCWAVRQGVVYHDLAFVQQDDGGDDWWTLKRDGDKWAPFESWSFDIAKWYPSRFSSIIASMELATPTQCKSLAYGLPENDLTWEVGTGAEGAWEGAPEIERWCRAQDGEYELRAYKLSGTDGFTAEVYAKEGNRLIYIEDLFSDALHAAAAAASRVENYRKHGITEFCREQTRESSIARAAMLRESARALAAQRDAEGKGRVR